MYKITLYSMYNMENNVNKLFLFILCCLFSCLSHVRAFNWNNLDSIEEIDIYTAEIVHDGMDNEYGRICLASGNIHLDESKLTWDRVSKRSLGQDSSIPREISTTIKHGGQDLTLRFQKQYKLRLPRISLEKDGSQTEHNVFLRHQCIWLYEDEAYNAFVLVDFCHVDMKFRMIGELFIKGEKHVVLPDKSSHRIFRCRDSPIFPGTNADIGPMESSQTKRSKRQTGTEYFIEMMFYVENSIYQFFYDNIDATGLTTAQREQQTLDEIRVFYSYIVTGMNYRYRELNTTEFTIQIKLVSVSIQQATNSLSTILNSGDLLDAFAAYVRDQLIADPNFPQVDHYMLLTRNNLVFGGTDDSAGLANQGTLCEDERSLATSIAEDKFNFMSEVIFTHELGHGLNAVHDGTNNACSSDDKFIMAVDNSLTAAINTLNLWRFSQCTVQSIEEFVDILNFKGNCMLTFSEPDLPEITPQGGPLGQIYLPDEQCRRIFTTGSAMSRIRYFNTTYEPICTGMWCTNNNVDTLALPADGTTCGDQKWCENGVCVTANDAPGINNNCPFGDQPTQVTSTENCTEILSGFLGQCYKDNIRFACCQSCESQKLNISGCEYGDRLICSSIGAASCYDVGLQFNCCKTCNDFEKPGLPDSCKYGDKNTDCTVNACQSSSNLDVCCETCKVDQPGGTSSESELPDWVIPAAAGGGGALLVIIILAAVCCTGRKRADRNVRRATRMESGRRGRRSDSRRRNDRYAQPDRRRGMPDYRNGRSSYGRGSVPYTSSSGNPYSRPFSIGDVKMKC